MNKYRPVNSIKVKALVVNPVLPKRAIANHEPSIT